MKHICAQPIMKFYHRKYMLQKKKINNERAKAKYAANMELCASKMPSKKVGLAQVVI